MGATIKDIAKAVGVSPSTVSRVMNQTAPISEEIKAKVYAAMKEMDYHPNVGARNLAKGNTNTIALIIDAQDEGAFSNSFFNRSVYAIERIAQENGYNLLISNDGPQKPSAIKDLVYGKKVDGIIVPSSILKKKLKIFLLENNMPFVMLGEEAEIKGDICWVDINNFQGSIFAVQHLIDRGYKNLIYIGDNRKTTFSKRRTEGFYYGKLPDIQREAIFVEGQNKIREEVINSIEKKRVDAVICANNVFAYEVIQAIKETGHRIPKDIGIVTFDNHPFAEYLEPPVTAIDVDTHKLGELAAKSLIKLIKEEKIEKADRLILPELIIRESSFGHAINEREGRTRRE